MSNETLYIIGNGFDIYHDLPTKFWHFGEYVKKNEPELNYYLERYFDYKSLWNEFEEVLSKLDISEVISDNQELFPDEESDRTGDLHILGDKAMQIVETLTVGLRKSLRDYLLQIKHPNPKSLVSLDKNAIFLTFNYTDTLERFYKIDTNRIKYIHNKAKTEKYIKPDEYYLKDESDIIIGHAVKDKNVTMPKQSNRGIKTAIACEEAFYVLEPYYKESFKDTKQIISENQSFFDSLSNVKKVIVFGHSLSNIDMPYFQEISKKAVNVREWKITYHGESELSDKEVQTFKFLSKLDNVSFLDSKDELVL